MEWYMSGVCVGNGFIRSERLVNIRGLLNGKWSVNTVGRGLAPAETWQIFEHFL